MPGPPFVVDKDNPTSNSLISAFPPNEQANRTNIEDWLKFISDPTTGIINMAAIPAAVFFPAGTKMLFVQTAAPVGWTKVVTHNDKALRVVSGTAADGGSVAFTTAFSSKTPAGTISDTTAAGTIGGTAITTAQMPAHTHGPGTLGGVTNTTGSHNHFYTVFSSMGGADGGGSFSAWSGTKSDTTGSDGAHSHIVVINAGVTGSNGSGATHDHTFTGTPHGHTFTGTAINLAVAYVDVIIAAKD